jgi:hypothetical protein
MVVDLVRILEERVNVVCLRRALPCELARAARRALGSPGLRFRVELDGAGPALDLLRRHISFPGGDLLVHDIAGWAEVLADLTGAEHVGVRLAHLDAPMCPRFHVDRVPLRLVSTYAGPGTEWLEDREGAGHRAGLRAGNGPTGRPEEECPGAQIRRCETGEILLLKGDGWPGNQGGGAVHRSPAVRPGQARLLMTLDPLWA